MLLMQLFFHTIAYFLLLTFKNRLFESKNTCPHLHQYPISSISKECHNNINFDSTTDEIIVRNGYEAISYGFVTDDGYIINLVRIPPKGNNTHNTPIFLQHGISADSSEFVLIGNRSLAFNLADQGYDVWMGNCRGTIYSSTHMEFEEQDKHYWNFNLDHLGKFDMRNSLQIVAEETGKAGEIILMGYSLGSTLSFMYASEYPEESSKLLKGIIALSPAVYFEPQMQIKFMFDLMPHYSKWMRFRGKFAMNEKPQKIQQRAQAFCHKLPFICLKIIELSDGKSYQFKPEDLLLYFSHYPYTVSLQQVMHYTQLYKSDYFQKFDYGEIENYRVYNQQTPPIYNLTKISVPVSLFYGKNDGFISQNSVERIFSELGGKDNYMTHIPVKSTKREDQFSHTDFIYAGNIIELFYNDLLERLTEVKAS